MSTCEVDDTQTGVSQSKITGHVDTTIIGTAMPQSRYHSIENAAIYRPAIRSVVPNSCNSAHSSFTYDSSTLPGITVPFFVSGQTAEVLSVEGRYQTLLTAGVYLLIIGFSKGFCWGARAQTRKSRRDAGGPGQRPQSKRLLYARGTVEKSFFVLCLLFSAAGFLAAQTPETAPAASPAARQESAEYVIGPEDVLSVSVWREPDLSLREVVVRPDGKISLPLVNDIQANGLTPRQLQDGITEKLKQYVSVPNVTVSVVRALSRSVSIVGQVARPGPYPLGAPMTILELLARAGGLTEYANEKSIKVVRIENGKTLQFPFNYKDAIKGKNLEQNITLKQGDVVMVP